MKLLICSNGHAPAERAVRYFARTAAACAAEVTLLGIIEHRADESPLQDALRRTAALLRDRGLAVEVVTRAGSPVEQIRTRTTEATYDLVLIGGEQRRHQATALSSKAYHLIKEVTPPVLVYLGERTDLQKVLLCTGGGSSSDPALELTQLLACKGNLEVTLFHITPEAPAIYASFGECDPHPETILESKSALGRHLRSHRDTLENAGVQVRVKICSGFLPRRILQELRESDYDLVVTGSAQTQGAIRTYMLGDITSEVVNRGGLPVLVTRPLPTAAQEGSWLARLSRRLIG